MLKFNRHFKGAFVFGLAIQVLGLEVSVIDLGIEIQIVINITGWLRLKTQTSSKSLLLFNLLHTQLRQVVTFKSHSEYLQSADCLSVCLKCQYYSTC